MMHRWDQLTFMHWSYEAADVQRLLPDGLRVETFDGRAWVGLVPFRMQVTLPHMPAIPWVSHFPETNVRTYATAPDGTTGVWFLSLDAARLGAVVLGRSSYRIPYFWSKMSTSLVGSVMTYESRRRWPGPRGARCNVAVEIGAPYADGEASDRDVWLTARWRLYSAPRSGLHFARADHPIWPLHHARLLHLDEELLAAAGLPPPVGDPLVHWSPGVAVRISLPYRLGPT